MATEYLTTAQRRRAARAVYQAPIIRLQMVREGTLDAAGHVRGPSDIAKFLAPRFADCDREVMVVVPLTTRNRIIAVEVVTIGSIDSAVITMREMFKAAVLCNAASVVAAHNHPSGDPTPSPEDIAITRRFIEAGTLLDICFLDHLVLGEGGKFASIRELHISAWGQQ